MNYIELTEPDRALLQSAIAAADRLYVQGIQEVGAAECKVRRNLVLVDHLSTFGRYPFRPSELS